MATTINLSWPANAASEGVIKYQLFQSVNGGAFTFLADVVASGSPAHQILNPAPGLYAWKVLAKNFVGDSGFSAVANGPDVPSTPGTITVQVVNS